MSEISDETLMAYADGELDAAGRIEVEAYLARDPASAGRLAAFTATGRTLGDMFGQPMREPVPQRLLDAVKGPARQSAHDLTTPATAPTAIIIPFESARRSRPLAAPSWTQTWSQPGALAAASIAVIAAGLGTYWILDQAKSDFGQSYGVAIAKDGAKIAGTALATALDTTPSGSSTMQTIDGTPATIKPVFTFANASQSYCRQYEISTSAATQLAGVACRDARGQWKVEVQVALDGSLPAAGKIVPAEKVSSATVDAIVDRIISGDVLGLEDEAAVMKNNWQATNPPAPDTNR